MTRQEFIDDVRDFGDLIDFCYDNGYDNCEYVRSRDDIDDYIRDEIDYFSREYDWDGLVRYAQALDLDSDWYDTYNSVDPLTDDDFERYKTDVLDAVDANGDWEDDEDDEEEYYDEEERLVSQVEEEQNEEAFIFGSFFDSFASAFVAAECMEKTTASNEIGANDIKLLFA